jgi:hypothetical protein
MNLVRPSTGCCRNKSDIPFRAVFALEMEAIPKGSDNFPRVVEVSPRERIVYIKWVTRIRNVQNSQAHCPTLANGPAELDIPDRIRLQMTGTIALQNTGAMNHIHGKERMPRQSRFEAGAERVSLVMIKVAE